MKKKLAVAIIFIVILVLPMVSWPIVSLFDLPTVEENREKAKFPEFGNDVFSQFDEYFADRAPYRDLLIKLYKSVERALKLLYENTLPHEDDVDYYTEVNNAIFGKEDWLFYKGDNSIDFYKGTNLPTEAELKDYVERAEKVNNYFKAQGKQFVILIAPNKEQMYSEYMPEGIKVVSETKRADVIYDYFTKHSDVTVVYPKAELLAVKKNYVTYYKQDTHWNNYGGYVGAKAILDALNISVGDVEITETQYRGGDLATMATMDGALYTAYNVLYRSEISLKYTVSTTYESVIESSNTNGKHLLLLGDSFREAMKEVLAKEYESSIVNHRDTFNVDNDFSEAFDAASTVIFQAVERYESSIFAAGGLLNRFIDIYGL